MKIDFSKIWIHYLIAVIYSALFSVMVMFIGDLGLKTLIGTFAVSCPAFLMGIHAIMPEAAKGVTMLPTWYRRMFASLSWIIPSFTSFSIAIKDLSFYNGCELKAMFGKTFWITVIICYLLIYKFFIVSAWIYESIKRENK